ncbi:hypothetical protein D3C85_1821110 [compost metagenome]
MLTSLEEAQRTKSPESKREPLGLRKKAKEQKHGPERHYYFVLEDGRVDLGLRLNFHDELEAASL